MNEPQDPPVETALMALAGTGLSPAFARKVEAMARRPVSRATGRAYRADWQRFEGWCQAHALVAYPASERTICAYLVAASEGYELTPGGAPVSKPGPPPEGGGASPAIFPPLKYASLARAFAAIRAVHAAAGAPLPSLPLVRNTLENVARAKGKAPRQAPPLMAGDVKRLAREDDDDGPEQVRDKALVLVGFAAALRRSELEALEVEDVAFSDEGMVITVRRSKTDQGGEGQPVAVLRGARRTCPVRALQKWLEVSGIKSGRIFDMSGRTITRLVRRMTLEAGLVGHFTGHSLRAGLATSAAKAGKSLAAIMKTTRHKSERVALGYVRHGSVFDDTAAEGLL